MTDYFKGHEVKLKSKQHHSKCETEAKTCFFIVNIQRYKIRPSINMNYLAVDTINQDLVTVISGDPSHERSSL